MGTNLGLSFLVAGEMETEIQLPVNFAVDHKVISIICLKAIAQITGVWPKVNFSIGKHVSQGIYGYFIFSCLLQHDLDISLGLIAFNVMTFYFVLSAFVLQVPKYLIRCGLWAYSSDPIT